ncbi:MAG: MoxR family ATPase [Proteobacteria bacterium]|nr:MoxR family ATPase [Pseudomonadota bacterium]
MSYTRFQLVNPKYSDKERQTCTRELATRPTSLATMRSHKEGASKFQPSDELVTAINIAIAVHAPLLLTGEPGTGKTQVAHYLAWYFGIEDNLFRLDVRSTTTVNDLLYRFDTVAYFHAAQDQSRRGEKLDRGEFIDRGPLWLAFETERPAIVLIDEIDKATRDFPNDLLNVLDQHQFAVPDLPHEDNQIPVRKLPEGKAPPIVVITSNSERRLPEPFLRRCVFHHIEFTEDILKKAVQAHIGSFPNLDSDVIDIALYRFMELRRRPLRKKPATAEFLVWLSVLSALGGINKRHVREPKLRDLPALATMVKDRDDLSKL